jgi:hypothetical protein
LYSCATHRVKYPYVAQYHLEKRSVETPALTWFVMQAAVLYIEVDSTQREPLCFAVNKTLQFAREEKICCQKKSDRLYCHAMPQLTSPVYSIASVVNEMGLQAPQRPIFQSFYRRLQQQQEL